MAGLCSKQIISHYTNTVEGVVGTYKLKAAVSIAQQFCVTVHSLPLCHVSAVCLLIVTQIMCCFKGRAHNLWVNS